MNEQTRPPVPRLPFFIGDAFMIGLAGFVYSQSQLPLDRFAIVSISVCVALGALLGILPFVLEYRVTLKLAETSLLTDALAQIENLEAIATQINQATGQWQSVQDHSAKTVAAATAIGERMTAEAKSFGEFMQKANDAEKKNLRLEVEKLHRSEGDWLQVLVRMLDHTHALHLAATRAGKKTLIDQLTQFQNAQRDAARRIGLAPIIASPGDAFDPAKHQAADTETPEGDAPIREIIATGYSFRGQLVRPVIVAIKAPAPAEADSASAAIEPEPEATPVSDAPKSAPESAAKPDDSPQPTLL